MKTRKEGFYWVKYDNEWQVAEWVNGEWHLIYLEMSRYSRHLDQIDENRIERNNGTDLRIEESKKWLFGCDIGIGESKTGIFDGAKMRRACVFGEEAGQDQETLDLLKDLNEVVDRALKDKPMPKFADGGFIHESKKEPKTDIFDFAKENEKGATTPALFKALEKKRKRDEIETCLNENICPYCGEEVVLVIFRDYFQCIDCGAQFNPKQL